MTSQLATDDVFRLKYGMYGRMLFKLALAHLGTRSDAEEAVQEAFIRLLYKSPIFADAEHEKAWLIRVMINICRNMRGSFWSRRVVKWEHVEAFKDHAAEAELVEAVLRLPFKYKAVIHLFYYEDYSVKEIAESLQITESAVKMRLQRARTMLRMDWEEERG